jgi:hypothetical protein
MTEISTVVIGIKCRKYLLSETAENATFICRVQNYYLFVFVREINIRLALSPTALGPK